MNELLRDAEGLFATRFGRRPRWLVVAPGRVNVIGEHVDYNGGLVLPMAIERYVVLAADRSREPSEPPTWQVHSSALGTEAHIRPAAPIPTTASSWDCYLQGVLTLGVQAGLEGPALDLLIHSNLPIGAGLSSSAALEVATATLMETVADRRLGVQEKIELCRQAEHRWAGVPCGIMDQTAALCSRSDHLLLLDCRSQERQYIPFDDPAVSLLVTNSMVRHHLNDSPYATRRSQCESAARKLGHSLRDVDSEQLARGADRLDAETLRRARHVVTEIERTEQAAAAITQRDWSRAGALMRQSHASLRDDYQVSCEELDLLVEIATALGERDGVYGSRMTGAGFGGCTVSLVETEQIDVVQERLASGYQERFGVLPEFIVSRPSAGAHVERATRG